MRVTVSTLLTALATFALFDGALAGTHSSSWKRAHHHRRRHYTPIDTSNISANNHDSDGRPSGYVVDVRKPTGHEAQVQKRWDSARFSFYDAGLGACGIVNSGDDFIVALNSAQFDSGSFCFKKITITINGKSTQATITDRCPGCPPGGLDFSRGLFKFFASEDVGIIHGAWNFGGGAPPAPKPPKIKVDLPEPVAPPPPPPPPPPPSSSATPSTTVAASSTTLSYSSAIPTSSYDASGTSGSSVPEPTHKPKHHRGCVQNLDLALVHLGAMIVSGARAGEN